MRAIRWLALIVALVGLVFVGRALERDTAQGQVGDAVVAFDDSLLLLPMDLCFSSITVDLIPPLTGDGVPETPFAGPICFSGEAVIRLLEAFDVGGKATIDTELVSMELAGTVNLEAVTLRAGAAQGQPPTPGEIQSLTGTDCPCASFFNAFFESSSATYPSLTNCLGQPVLLNATIFTFPDFSTPYTPVAGLDGCDSGGALRAIGAGIEAEPEQSIGGTVELLAASGAPESAAGSSSGSGFNYAIVGGALAAVAAAVAVAGGLYARKRWLW